MPALYTHYKLGNEVLKKLNKKVKDEINGNISYYNMYNQGWDNLYYHFKWSYYKSLGSIAHKKKINEFFSNLITYIKDNNLTNNPDITNIVYGFINHYTLDTIVHPFINYQVKNLGIPHSKIEFILDNMLYIEDENKLWKGYLFKTLIPKLSFSPDLLNTLNYTFEMTHKEKNIGKIFNTSHNNGYYLYRYFIFDKLGIKTFIYKLIDYIIPFKKFKFHKCTYYIKDYNENILNNEKNSWHHPNNVKEIYNYSFKELYNYSLDISVKINNLAYEVIHNKKELDDLITYISKINIKNIQELLEK